jgi:hypothetical protein
MSFVGELLHTIVRDVIVYYGRKACRKWAEHRGAKQPPPPKKKRTRSKRRGVPYE